MDSLPWNKYARIGSPTISTVDTPKSISSWCPGGISKRTVAFASADSRRRCGATARSRFCRTTSARRSPLVRSEL